MNELGSLIKDARKELKITTSQLANFLGISQGYVSHIENGVKTPSPEVIRKISQALNLDLNTLMILAGYLEGAKDKLPPSLRVHFTKEMNTRVSASKISKELTNFKDFIKWINICLDKSYYEEYNEDDLQKIFEDKTALYEFIFKGLYGTELKNNEATTTEQAYYVHLESPFVLEPIKLEEVINKAQSLSFNNHLLSNEERTMIMNVLKSIFYKNEK